jgi:hypothetical protein
MVAAERWEKTKEERLREKTQTGGSNASAHMPRQKITHARPRCDHPAPAAHQCPFVVSPFPFPFLFFLLLSRVRSLSLPLANSRQLRLAWPIGPVWLNHASLRTHHPQGGGPPTHHARSTEQPPPLASASSQTQANSKQALRRRATSKTEPPTTHQKVLVIVCLKLFSAAVEVPSAFLRCDCASERGNSAADRQAAQGQEGGAVDAGKRKGQRRIRCVCAVHGSWRGVRRRDMHSGQSVRCEHVTSPSRNVLCTGKH